MKIKKFILILISVSAAAVVIYDDGGSQVYDARQR